MIDNSNKVAFCFEKGGIVYVYVMLCAIWYHLHSSKNVKNTHGGELLLVKTLAFLLKVTLIHGCFLCFLNCTNSTKLRKASHIIRELAKYPAVEQGQIVGWCNVLYCYVIKCSIFKFTFIYKTICKNLKIQLCSCIH